MPFLRQKNGRWSAEKIVAFAIAIAPALWLAGWVVLDDLGPRPVTEAIHFSGRWAVRLLLLSLAITPLRRLVPLGNPLLARRTLGVAACCYALFHFVLYVVDLKYDLAKVATEIVLRFYLTIGFVALVGLIALAATSTDAAIRRLGQRWISLHRAAYVIAVLTILHFMLQKKLDIYEPILMTGFLLWLLGFRLWRRWIGPVELPQLAALAIATAALTAAFEALWYRAMTGVNPLRVLEANLVFDFDIRPMWWVLATGVAVTLVYAVGRRWQPMPRVRAAAGQPRRVSRSKSNAVSGEAHGQSGS
jgi:sulfoxide reductase heme-binding subunit YedZ